MKTAIVRLRIAPEEKNSWGRAADDAGLSLSQWIRNRLNSTIVASSVMTVATNAEPGIVATKEEPDLSTTAHKLCRRCARIGYALCLDCRKAAGLL